MTSNAKLPVSVLILTENEELNIGYAIESVYSNFSQIIVVDSFSADSTVEVCKRYPGVEIYTNKFENWAEQRNWLLNNAKISNDIVFFLDADEYVTPGFTDELSSIITSKVYFDAIYSTPAFVFLGQRLEYAYGHPKIRRIFKKQGLKFYSAGARERAVSGDVLLEIKHPFVHQDRKPIASWISKHNSNAIREAAFYKSNISPNLTEVLPLQLRVRTHIRAKVWDRLPLLLRPFLYFIYRYFFQFGFFDGRKGFVYCFFHAFWYQMLIDVMIIEKNLQSKVLERSE